MRTTTQILPGIKSIGWLDCQHLPRRVDLHGICGTPVAVLTAVTPIAFFEEPECECKTERESGHSNDTAKLKFRCGVLLPIHRTLGFVVTDVNGKSYLIGSQEPPFPKLKVDMRCGTPEGDPAGYHYEITHTAIKSMVECVASY